MIAALGLTVPYVISTVQALFPSEPATLLVEPKNDSCSTRWYAPLKDKAVLERVATAEDQERDEWQQEGRLAHAGAVEAGISVHGNAGKSVEIRDVSVTVTQRSKPAPGVVTGPPGCGGPDKPEYLVVDLDTLPLNRPVSASYLLGSPQQSAARKEAATLGSPLNIPRTVEADSFYPLFLIGRTQRYDCKWKATITWWDGKEVHKSTIADSGGRPFRVVTTAAGDRQ